MDPGNLAASINGGQSFQYLLISIILLSSMMAMLFQYMVAKLGIVTQLDLAQAIRLHTDKYLSFILWIITELAYFIIGIILILLSWMIIEMYDLHFKMKKLIARNLI